jgi:hypothetical protein
VIQVHDEVREFAAADSARPPLRPPQNVAQLVTLAPISLKVQELVAVVVAPLGGALLFGVSSHVCGKAVVAEGDKVITGSRLTARYSLTRRTGRQGLEPR